MRQTMRFKKKFRTLPTDDESFFVEVQDRLLRSQYRGLPPLRSVSKSILKFYSCIDHDVDWVISFLGAVYRRILHTFHFHNGRLFSLSWKLGKL